MEQWHLGVMDILKASSSDEQIDPILIKNGG